MQLDSAVRHALTDKLIGYVDAISREPIDVQKKECDFLIASTEDSLIRNHIAQIIYDLYFSSHVMGAEAVAIHVYDKWFQPGLVKMESDMDLLGAKIFAEFNRQSQIGCQAPELIMKTPDGNYLHLFAPDEHSGRFKVLYFYDTDCSKCRLQTIVLRNLLSTENFPIEFYGIYTGDNHDEWQNYIDSQWKIEAGRTSIYHLWDPEIDSDFQRKYGVLQTPRMFLVAPDGTIIGRGLDPVALSQMLHSIFDEVELDYGSEESEALFDGIFAETEPSANDIKSVVDHIAESTLPKGDTIMFRQMTGDLLYYLSSRSGEGVKEGLAELIKGRILSQPKIWRSSGDSLKVVGLASIMDDLLSKSAPGAVISDLKVPGTLVTCKGEKQKSRKLSRLGGSRNIVIFYTEGCNVCDAQKKAARRLVRIPEDGKDAALARKTRVFFVNVDEIFSTDPALATRLFDTFDLSSLPFLLETDRRGTIIRRYFYL